MQDSSPFRWLEERGPACQLIAVIDDATSKFWGRFTEHDSTGQENLRTFREWLQRYGRPWAHYTDKNSIFRTTRRAAIGEQLQGEEARSQFGRALRNWGSNGSQRTVRKPRGGSNDCSKPCRIAW